MPWDWLGFTAVFSVLNSRRWLLRAHRRSDRFKSALRASLVSGRQPGMNTRLALFDYVRGYNFFHLWGAANLHRVFSARPSASTPLLVLEKSMRAVSRSSFQPQVIAVDLSVACGVCASDGGNGWRHLRQPLDAVWVISRAAVSHAETVPTLCLYHRCRHPGPRHAGQRHRVWCLQLRTGYWIHRHGRQATAMLGKYGDGRPTSPTAAKRRQRAPQLCQRQWRYGHRTSSG